VTGAKTIKQVMCQRSQRDEGGSLKKKNYGKEMWPDSSCRNDDVQRGLAH
jgi:hypothetical protein